MSLSSSSYSLITTSNNSLEILENIESIIKDIFTPTTLFNILNKKGSIFYSSKMDTGRDNSNIYIYYILDILRIRTLYLIENHNDLYISPINDKNFRKYLFKNREDIDIDKIEKSLKRIQRRYQNNQVDANNFDLIIKHGILDNEEHIEFNYPITLINNTFHVSSIISNQDHMISLSKCNGELILNSTWNSHCNIAINSRYFIPGKEENYELASSGRLTAITRPYTRKCKKDLRLSLKKVNYEDSNTYTSYYRFERNSYILGNLHFFCPERLRRYNYDIDESIKEDIYPANNTCSSIYLAKNKIGICWLISIISALCYPDIISLVILNKTNNRLNKIILTLNNTLEIIDRALLDIDINGTEDSIYIKDPIKFNNLLQDVIYIYMFTYCSYYIIKKQQTNHITNKKHWLLNLENIYNNKENITELFEKYKELSKIYQ